MARDDPQPFAQRDFSSEPKERDKRGHFKKRSALDRFREKCEFDPTTGCVIWVGGRTRGRGNTTQYGAFKYEGRRWFAHRWAAVFIHGLDVGADTVGHCCPHGDPNSLCVQHLHVETLSENVAERNTRVAANNRAKQSSGARQYWLFVEKGIEPEPETTETTPGEGIPFHEPPEWLRGPIEDDAGGDCPF